ncbi:hypothetical protein CDL15_Pgr006584 [Punica granatum]|uniref:Uncharacterized protein n=1 Tax=Punica granatum TaxID=22663 RepID=A0A218XZ25_PUNGR|nr:hypothetical protein CDL15_Pgr006584 [Punica granatum]
MSRKVDRDDLGCAGSASMKVNPDDPGCVGRANRKVKWDDPGDAPVASECGCKAAVLRIGPRGLRLGLSQGRVRIAGGSHTKDNFTAGVIMRLAGGQPRCWGGVDLPKAKVAAW